MKGDLLRRGDVREDAVSGAKDVSGLVIHYHVKPYDSSAEIVFPERRVRRSMAAMSFAVQM
jgi:hypothetical protein